MAAASASWSTGTSSGIGHATAVSTARAGSTTAATLRDEHPRGPRGQFGEEPARDEVVTEAAPGTEGVGGVRGAHGGEVGQRVHPHSV